MKTLTLSGGNFGGEEVSVEDDVKIVEKTDDIGTWIYSTEVSINENQADFIGMKEK